jgi:uncharacterized membrane protein
MTQFLSSLSVWLHSLATIVLIGHYLLLSLIYLPVLMKNPPEAHNGVILSEISKRSRVWLYASLLIFFITGIYLMLVDPNYQGIGNFGNTWAILMLIKHILVLGMVAMGFWFNAILRVGPLMSSNSGAAQALANFRRYSNWMAIAGVVVLLLTAFAQIR